MTIYPLQFFGVGDCIFTQTLINAIANGSPIIWGVMSQFVEGLNRAYPNVQWVDYKTLDIDFERKEDVIIGDKHIIPIRFADQMMQAPYSTCMAMKYKMYSLDWKVWRQDAMWQRDTAKETELQTVLGIADGERYNLINKHFRSNNTGAADIDVNNGLRNVYMHTLEGFSLFDWYLIIQNAVEIHTVNTAILYILELMDISMPIHLYKRLPDETDFKNTEYLFTKPYILH